MSQLTYFGILSSFIYNKENLEHIFQHLFITLSEYENVKSLKYNKIPCKTTFIFQVFKSFLKYCL